MKYKTHYVSSHGVFFQLCAPLYEDSEEDCWLHLSQFSKIVFDVTLINSNTQIATAVTYNGYAQTGQICNSRALICKRAQLKVKISARRHRHYKARLVQRHISAKVQRNYVKRD
jgi:hypothetical protein